MSQKREAADGNEDEAKESPTLESLQQYLAAQAEERDAAAERTQNVLARFFKVAIVIVCLNVVIAGANVAMIAIRPSSPPALPPPAPAAAVMAEPARPVAVPPILGRGAAGEEDPAAGSSAQQPQKPAHLGEAPDAAPCQADFGETLPFRRIRR
jgi:hypothetical protein